MESEFSTIDFLLVTIGWVTFVIVASFNENRTKGLELGITLTLEYTVPPISGCRPSCVIRAVKAGQMIRKRVRKVVGVTAPFRLPFFLSVIVACIFIVYSRLREVIL